MGLREMPYCWGFFGAMSRTASFFTSQSRQLVKKLPATVSAVSFCRNFEDPTATTRVANIVALVAGSVVVPPSYAAAMVTGPGMSVILLKVSCFGSGGVGPLLLNQPQASASVWRRNWVLDGGWVGVAGGRAMERASKMINW